MPIDDGLRADITIFGRDEIRLGPITIYKNKAYPIVRRGWPWQPHSLTFGGRPVAHMPTTSV